MNKHVSHAQHVQNVNADIRWHKNGPFNFIAATWQYCLTSFSIQLLTCWWIALQSALLS